MPRHPTTTITIYPDTEKAMREIMARTGRHKGAVLREAVELGLEILQRNHNLQKCEQPINTTEPQLRQIIREELAALVKESIMSSVTLASQAKASDSLTAEEVARIQQNIDNAVAKAVADARSHQVI